MANSGYYRSNRFSNPNRESENDQSAMIRWHFCFGDSASLNSYLKSQNGCGWTLPKFINAVFRGIGQVVFANNPFSGMLIFAGIIWYNVTIGLLVLASASITVLTAVMVNIHPKSIIAGLVTFNAVLLSSVTSSLWTPLYKEPLSLHLYIFILIGSAFSVLISNGLTNILSSFKPVIPILSIPFHILVFVTFLCLKPHSDSTILVHHEAGIVNGNSAIASSLSKEEVLYNRTLMVSREENFFADLNQTDSGQFYTWDNLQNVALGVALSSGQVFGIADFLTSLLIYAAILIYSPILTFMCLHGAVIATVLGLFMTPFPNEEIFLGVWGFNGFLSCGAIGVFYIFNSYSLINGTANAVFTALIQFILSPYFAKHNIPVFGLPFILSTLLFISVTSNGPQLVRVKVVSYPEQQRCSYYRKRHEDEVMLERNLISP